MEYFWVVQEVKEHTHTDEVRRKISEKNKGKIPWNKDNGMPKLKWLTPNGEIKYMDKGNVGKWHKDWILYTGDQT